MIKNPSLPFCFSILSLLFIINLLFTSNAYSQITVEAGVSYEVEGKGFTEYYFRESDLRNGRDLNRRTNSHDFSVRSDYALVWFSDDQVAIIQLEEKFSSSLNELTKVTFDMTKAFHGINHEGIDRNGTRWKICFSTMRLLCSI